MSINTNAAARGSGRPGRRFGTGGRREETVDTPRLGTLADPQDPVFQQNTKVNEALAGELRDRLAAAGRGGPQRARDRPPPAGP